MAKRSQKSKAAHKSGAEFALVGSGQLARVLALALHDAGYRISEIISRDLPDSKKRAQALARKVGSVARSFADADLSAGVIWLCVADDVIPQCAQSLAAMRSMWKGRMVLHSSGALSSEELQPFRRLGAVAATAHPLMSFVAGSPGTLAGVPVAIEGDIQALPRLKAILRRLGASAFKIEKSSKPAYHAFGAFSSPLLIAYLSVMESVGELAGLGRLETRKRAEGIVRTTINNYFKDGPEASLSGPLRRGDTGTIRRHLRALEREPSLAEIYRGLIMASLKNLRVKNREEIARLVARD
jgi:predicted short-subunit dehydrogenase-like oxidoreductase (DUF2520 family)